MLPKLAVTPAAPGPRFSHRSAQLICTEPHDPGPPCTTDPSRPLLIRANATQTNHAGRTRMSRTRLKTATTFEPSLPPYSPGQRATAGIGQLVSGSALCSDSATVFPMLWPRMSRVPGHRWPG